MSFSDLEYFQLISIFLFSKQQQQKTLNLQSKRHFFYKINTYKTKFYLEIFLVKFKKFKDTQQPLVLVMFVVGLLNEDGIVVDMLMIHVIYI